MESAEVNVLRIHVRSLLKVLINENESSNRKEQILSHVDNCLQDFSNQVKALAVENDHPYVRTYLLCALHDFKKDIQSGSRRFVGIDEMLLNPNMQP